MSANYDRLKRLEKKVDNLVQNAITEIIDASRPLGQSGGKNIYATCPPKHEFLTPLDYQFGRASTAPKAYTIFGTPCHPPSPSEKETGILDPLVLLRQSAKREAIKQEEKRKFYKKLYGSKPVGKSLAIDEEDEKWIQRKIPIAKKLMVGTTNFWDDFDTHKNKTKTYLFIKIGKLRYLFYNDGSYERSTDTPCRNWYYLNDIKYFHFVTRYQPNKEILFEHKDGDLCVQQESSQLVWKSHESFLDVIDKIALYR